MSVYIIPVLILAVLICCIVKKVPIYDTFTEGAKGAINLILSIFPCLIAIFWGVELFRVSGLSKMTANFVAPFFNLLGIPSEICELVLLRPFSGNGSLAVLTNIYQTYGVDSYISRCASVVMGCSETVFYIAALYFAGIKNKKLSLAIPISLFACFMGSIVGCLLCRIF